MVIKETVPKRFLHPLKRKALHDRLHGIGIMPAEKLPEIRAGRAEKE